MEINPSVLIAGGSLNGLTTAMLLARRGVSCLVVERHARTSIQYKFRGISPRSMEIYRSAGIEADIRARDLIEAVDGTTPALDLERLQMRHAVGVAQRVP